MFYGWSRLAKLRRRGMRAAKVLKAYDLVIAHNFPASAMLGAAQIQARKIWQCNEPPRGIHRRAANPVLTARALATGGQGPEEATLAFARHLELHDLAMAGNTSVRARHTYDMEVTRGLDLIYAISEFSRDNARRIYGRCREEVIYPIVRFPEGGWNRAGLERSVRRVLVHSRLEVLKNIDTVIRGFSSFQGPARFRASCTWWVRALPAPSWRPWRGKLCPAGSVRFHGYLSEEDLRRVYEAVMSWPY